MKNVVIIGASGHGKVVADIVAASGDKLIGFLDDDLTKNPLGYISDYSKYMDCYFVIAIGDAATREKISKLPLKWHTAIHPSAIVSPSVTIGEGTVVMPNAVINAGSSVGKHCIINTSSVVEHDNNIGDFSHISVGAKLGGTVSIGKSCWIGLGSSISNNVTICDCCVIGAGALVIHDIHESGTYVGVPAKKND